MSESRSVLITGASGLLGRAMVKVFNNEVEGGKWKRVYGTAFSRSGPGLVKLDLNDVKAVAGFIEENKPDFVVHSAAQRWPDKVDKDYEGARKLNVDATATLAKKTAEYGGRMLYISTDYVFDGDAPPYKHDAKTNPVNVYGQLKLDGEKATLDACSGHMVLRSPILYGPVEYLEESAVTTLINAIKDKSNKPVVSDYEVRRPSHVNDLARVAQGLLLKQIEKGESVVKGVYQWCGDEELTKYGMVKIMGEQLGLDTSHVVGNSEKPPEGGVKRPRDTTMDRSRVEGLGIGSHTPFAEGIKEALKGML